MDLVDEGKEGAVGVAETVETVVETVQDSKGERGGGGRWGGGEVVRTSLQDVHRSPLHWTQHWLRPTCTRLS